MQTVHTPLARAVWWRRAGFVRLATTRVVSLAADAMLQTALAAAVFFNPERATSAGQAAAGFAVLLLPYSLVGPFAGVWLDRWRRARVLVVANLTRAGLVAAVAGLLTAHGPTGPLFLVTALAALSVNRLIAVTAAAALPHVVDPPRLASANAVWTGLGLAAGFAGAAAGLAVRAAGGAGDRANASAALAAAAVCAVSALVAAGFPAAVLGPDHGVRAASAPGRRAGAMAGGALGDAARYLRGHRPVVAGVAAIAAFRFFYGISTIATLLLYRNYFTDSGWLRTGITGAAQVVVAAVAGSLLAAAVTPAIVRRWSPRRWIIALLVAAAAVQVALGVPYQTGPLLAAAVVLGMVAQGTRICVDTLVQQQVRDGLRARVFSFYDTLFNVSFVAAAVIAALALPDTGKSYPMLTFIAVGYAVTAAGYAAATRVIDHEPGRSGSPPTR